MSWPWVSTQSCFILRWDDSSALGGERKRSRFRSTLLVNELGMLDSSPKVKELAQLRRIDFTDQLVRKRAAQKSASDPE